MESPLDPEARLRALEEELVRQKKINDALKERVKQSIRSSGDSFSLFESNIALQREVERRTRDLVVAVFANRTVAHRWPFAPPRWTRLNNAIVEAADPIR